MSTYFPNNEDNDYHPQRVPPTYNLSGQVGGQGGGPDPLPPPPPYQPQGLPVTPPKKKTRWGLIIGIAVAVVLVICGVGVACTAFLGKAVNDAANALSTTQPAVVNPAPSDTETDPAQPPPSETFDLAPGTVVTLTDNDGSWTIKVSNPVWKTKACNSFGSKPEQGRYLVADVEFEVTDGTASINRLNFGFHDSEGVAGEWAIFSGCDEPRLDSDNELRKGTKRKGKIVFDATGKAGTIDYAPGLSGPEASWSVKAA